VAPVGEVVLEIPARPDYVSLARQVVAAAAEAESGLHDERIDDLRLAVSEAATNAIEAHADLSSDERIVIRCDLAEDRIEVEVLDRGSGFEVGDLEAVPDSTDPSRLRHERGLGIPLIRVLVDEAEITSSAGGTTVRLVVFRGPGDHEPGDQQPIGHEVEEIGEVSDRAGGDDDHPEP
jgi:serine/threonine-protein kinase RsbW